MVNSPSFKTSSGRADPFTAAGAHVPAGQPRVLRLIVVALTVCPSLPATCFAVARPRDTPTRQHVHACAPLRPHHAQVTSCCHCPPIWPVSTPAPSPCPFPAVTAGWPRTMAPPAARLRPSFDRPVRSVEMAATMHPVPSLTCALQAHRHLATMHLIQWTIRSSRRTRRRRRIPSGRSTRAPPSKCSRQLQPPAPPSSFSVLLVTVTRDGTSTACCKRWRMPSPQAILSSIWQPPEKRCPIHPTRAISR